ncbi:hypothetical protein CN085_03875 [Sinorhizobium meliloti]|nr:hypothetical protein CDO28_25190 [Sinorhizobium meliloti]RVG80219.1 hypothetical protein CN223_07080 [Sinorhizobium meliloti]RVI70556.1 hypothetical protein CN189_00785 [Sinorhizobium meliloti]RVP17646.1 hypothetical protein CN085_03875 [Sinorhizobium meliloti]
MAAVEFHLTKCGVAGVAHFGPEPPASHLNWVKTLPGRGWFAYLRWYGPTEGFSDNNWSLPDIEPEL